MSHEFGGLGDRVLVEGFVGDLEASGEHVADDPGGCGGFGQRDIDLGSGWFISLTRSGSSAFLRAGMPSAKRASTASRALQGKHLLPSRMSSMPQLAQMNGDALPAQGVQARVPSSPTDATRVTRWHRGQGRRVPRMMSKQGLQVAPPVKRTLTRAVRPQCTQGSTFPGAHSGQSGPSGVVDAPIAVKRPVAG
ncbi:hypothetical protein [Microbacterium lacticum]